MNVQHQELLEQAVHACRTREHFSPFPQRPGKDASSLESIETARATYESYLGGRVELDQPAVGQLLCAETSPFTRDSLGVSYPVTDAQTAFATARQVAPDWARLEPQHRVDLCLEMVEQLYQRWYEIAHANQHTTGQSFSMSCVGSGVNALDRGIEAIAYASEAMRRVPSSGRWQREFGRTEVALDKRYHLLPRGPAVVVTCASFPTWNAYPALFANLATGNPVIVKPHPTSVLTMALMVQVAQQVLADAGLPAPIVQLAADSPEKPITKELIEHPDCRIVDFTGSPSFGAWIERNAHPAIAFTETAGVNTVVLDSVEDLRATASAIATSLGLFSAQMCTSVQNIYLPEDGIRTPEGTVAAEEVVEALVEAVEASAGRPERAAGLMGAVQSSASVDLVGRMEQAVAERGRIARTATPYVHPEYPEARTLTPSIGVVDPAARELFGEERFGPVSFVVRCGDRDDALAQAIEDVAARGSIASHVYSTDDGYVDRAARAYLDAGSSVSLNLTGPMPLNFAAAYSDYHVTGLSPAGNACLTDEAFIAGRFRVAQVREPVK